jgi:hypothetical protein
MWSLSYGTERLHLPVQKVTLLSPTTHDRGAATRLGCSGADMEDLSGNEFCVVRVQSTVFDELATLWTNDQLD